MGDCPGVGVGAEEVADGGELGFGLGGPGLLVGGFDDGFGGGFDDGELGLGGGLLGCLVVGAQPADLSVAFFFGALGVELDEPFQNLFVEAGLIVGQGQGA